jgi:hypothetical protein
LLHYLWVRDDRRYWLDTSKIERMLYYVFPFGGRKLLIPKGHDLIQLVSNAVEEFLAYLDGKNPTVIQNLARSIVETMPLLGEGVGVGSFLYPVAPVVENLVNWLDYFERPIENLQEKMRAPETRRSGTTSRFAQWIVDNVTGGVTWLPEMLRSPKQVDHLLQRYGVPVMRIFDAFAEFVLPVKSPLTTLLDAVAPGYVRSVGSGSEAITTFYERAKRLREIRDRYNSMKKSPEMRDRAVEFASANRDALVELKRLEAFQRKFLDPIEERVRRLLMQRDMPPKEREEALRDLYIRYHDLAARYLAMVDPAWRARLETRRPELSP